jgi:hypothetical protein
MSQAIQSAAMRIFVLLCAGAVAVFGGVAAAQTDTGLYGKVVIYPALPVCQQGSPCSKPAGNVLLRFWRNGHRVAAVRTHANGTFRLALKPGTYGVTTPAGLLKQSGLHPRRATVPLDRFARQNFTLDVGIR